MKTRYLHFGFFIGTNLTFSAAFLGLVVCPAYSDYPVPMDLIIGILGAYIGGIAALFLVCYRMFVKKTRR